MDSRKRRDIPERLNPGDPEPLEGSPGSIEQQLDMSETGELRGDEILHSHGNLPSEDPDLEDPNEMLTNFHFDMAEEGREGDEMSGDDHSSGLQGGEREMENQDHIASGLPGDED
ncbi:MAG: hypothetical protein A2428_14895 [Bdellovibrionales bacterium RIFOXYC1_FULL_54_43]|nr:MAG: hypothetical protein A2428_14895 [Bdellovibrionales bacterium RIFOXYC1_FULL_54_43]OFZ84160.1 MAG: hypothetical protein A2603_07775 [Bdellovibrionales bacterium RIFOXYD1_FULL_55_31]